MCITSAFYAGATEHLYQAGLTFWTGLVLKCTFEYAIFGLICGAIVLFCDGPLTSSAGGRIEGRIEKFVVFAERP